MKKIKVIFVLLALLLCLSLLLQGCSLAALGSVMADMDVVAPESIIDWDDLTEEEETEDTEKPTTQTEPDAETESTEPVEPTETTEPTEPDDTQTSDHTPYQEYERYEIAPMEEIPFDEIVYERPDTQAMIDGFAKIGEMAAAGEDADDILDAFDALYGDYAWFHTMSTYAYIRYCLDLDDSFYDEENSWCDEQSPLLSQAEENCYIAMGESSLREELERKYFGEGFFDYYDQNQIYSNDRVVELMQEESNLQNEYMALQNEMTITWQGEEQLVEELLSDPSLDYNSYMEIYRLYYEKYNPLCAEIFIQLVGIRQEIAAELGYESYAHFAYEYTYERDYTPEQVKAYTNDIALELSDMYYTAVYTDYSAEMDTTAVMDNLKTVAYSFGGDIATSYDYMEAYGLYDLSESPSKMPGSYVTYLYSYGMPYMYVSPTGDISDCLTAVHEFGHFVDNYVNCGYTYSIDCAEIFSQGLEYLSIDRMDLSTWDKRSLTDAKLGDAILTFLGQGCYAEFEQRVYDIPAEELTAEKINEIFYECNEKFGMGMYGMEDILAPGWIDIQHFFIAPYYVISYCISNDVALQIYQNELNSGSGLESYYALLERSAGNTILALVDEAGMKSPFETGRMAELADFFAAELE
ncbi:MAG: hypothetical protein IJ453_05130 [Oscillospiraceae bacterium]|nr:hypothetical protein [Oscillospiraceae bacterium]